MVKTLSHQLFSAVLVEYIPKDGMEINHRRNSKELETKQNERENSAIYEYHQHQASGKR